jgi:hypothetical protein
MWLALDDRVGVAPAGLPAHLLVEGAAHRVEVHGGS